MSDNHVLKIDVSFDAQNQFLMIRENGVEIVLDISLLGYERAFKVQLIGTAIMNLVDVDTAATLSLQGHGYRTPISRKNNP